jgi:gas vesicle protein
MLNDTIGTARNAGESALLDGLHIVGGIARMLRGVSLDNGLAWIGLSRRRGALRDLAVFSAGLAVGAGAGLLLAPMAGADTRRSILEQMKGVKTAEHKVENKIAEGAEALGDKIDAAADAVKDKVDAAAEAVKHKVDAVAGAVTETTDAAADAMDKRADMRSRMSPRARDGHRVS